MRLMPSLYALLITTGLVRLAGLYLLFLAFRW